MEEDSGWYSNGVMSWHRGMQPLRELLGRGCRLILSPTDPTCSHTGSWIKTMLINISYSSTWRKPWWKQHCWLFVVLQCLRTSKGFFQLPGLLLTSKTYCPSSFCFTPHRASELFPFGKQDCSCITKSFWFPEVPAIVISCCQGMACLWPHSVQQQLFLHISLQKSYQSTFSVPLEECYWNKSVPGRWLPGTEL